MFSSFVKNYQEYNSELQYRKQRLKRILIRQTKILTNSVFKRLYENHFSYKMIAKSIIDFVRIIRRIKKKLIQDSFRSIEKKSWIDDCNHYQNEASSSVTKSFVIIIKNQVNKVEIINKKEAIFQIKFRAEQYRNMIGDKSSRCSSIYRKKISW